MRISTILTTLLGVIIMALSVVAEYGVGAFIDFLPIIGVATGGLMLVVGLFVLLDDVYEDEKDSK